MAGGSGKADIVHRTLTGPVDEIVPATLLREHPAATFYLDAAAAAKL
jgi:glucosamine-6-phosphate deaminase